MSLDDYRVLFLVATLVLALVAASPVLGVVVPFDGGSERFSELWLLGADHMAQDYPYNVVEGEEYTVFVGVGNHMGNSEYYMVCVKFCNSTVSFLDIDGGVPSGLSPLMEYRFFVGDGMVWESAVTFGFKDVSVVDDVLSVGSVVVDGVVFPVDAVADWDSEAGGFIFRLFFELWRYDVESQVFGFDGRVVGLRLNMTA
jgi:hypothetical protein